MGFIQVQAMVCIMLSTHVAITSVDARDLIPRKYLVATKDHDNVQLSPDGKYLSWVGSHMGAANVFIAPVENPNSSVAITTESGIGVHTYYWAYDNVTLIYYVDKTGEEIYKLFKYNVASKETAPLITGDKADRAQQLFVSLAGLCLSVSPKRPNNVVVGIKSETIPLFDPYMLDLSDGTVRQITHNPGYPFFMFDQQLNLRLGWSYDPLGVTTYEYNATSNTWIQFKSVLYEDNALLNIPLVFDEEGTHVTWMDTELREYMTIVKIKMSDKSQVVLHRMNSTTQRPVPIDMPSGSPLVYFEERTMVEIIPSDSMKDDVQFMKDAGVGDIAGIVMDYALNTAVVYMLQKGGLTTFYLYKRSPQSLTKLFNDRTILQQHNISPIHPVEVMTRDNNTMICYMTYPHSAGTYDPSAAPASRTPLPAVIQVHGGPYSRDNYAYDEKAQLYADRGYVVFQCNFRGSIGYGKTWMKLSYGQWGGTMNDDILDAADWAIAQRIANPEKFAVTGHSYGGYATLFTISYNPDRWTCAVAEAARTYLPWIFVDWPGAWQREDYAKKLGYADLPTQEEKVKFLAAVSPLAYAPNVKKPLLISQGENDPRVKKQEPDRFVDLMKSFGKEVGYVVFPGEGHELIILKHKLANMAIIENFLKEYLGGEAEELGSDLEDNDVKYPSRDYISFVPAPTVPPTPACPAHCSASAKVSISIVGLFTTIMISIFVQFFCN